MAKTDISLSIQLAAGCNLACSYCYEKNKSNVKLDKDIVKQRIDMLCENIASGKSVFKGKKTVSINFIGGEPFLETELMRELSEYVIEKFEHEYKLNEEGSTTFEITTNGTVLTDPKVLAYLKDYGSRIELSVSIDGIKDVHDKERVFVDGRETYDIICENVKYLLKQNITFKDFSARITLLPQHAGRYAEGLINLIEMGFKKIIVSSDKLAIWDENSAKVLTGSYMTYVDYLIEHNLQDEIYLSDFDPYLGSFSIKGVDTAKYMCKCGGQVAIDVHGSFYPCVTLAEHSLKNTPFKYDVKDGLILNTEYTNQIEEAYFEGCEDCPIALGCESCAMADYRLCGKPGIKSKNRCFYHKAKVLGNHYYYGKLYGRRIFYPREWGEVLMGKENFEKLMKSTNSPLMAKDELIADHKQYLLDMEQKV